MKQNQYCGSACHFGVCNACIKYLLSLLQLWFLKASFHTFSFLHTKHSETIQSFFFSAQLSSKFHSIEKRFTKISKAAIQYNIVHWIHTTSCYQEKVNQEHRIYCWLNRSWNEWAILLSQNFLADLLTYVSMAVVWYDANNKIIAKVKRKIQIHHLTSSNASFQLLFAHKTFFIVIHENVQLLRKL